MSGSDLKKKTIPVPPVLPAGNPGNLLSSIAPPSELPNFVTAPPVLQKPNVIVPVSQPVQPTAVGDNAAVESSEQETFSPAIPPNKGEPTLPIRSPEDSQATQSPESLPPSTPEIDRIGDVMPGSGLLTWMKGAVSSGGILQRVAEKAKSSVDTMITTLDPQMKEYLKSGGDLYLVVASDKEVNVSPIREAFQNVFGKATVVGEASQSDVTAAQAVGSAAAYAAAKQRLAHVRATAPHINNNVPVIAVQSYLQETVGDRWYEILLVLVSQPSLGIEVQVQSQGTPVPAAALAALAAATPAHYAHAQTGYALTIASVMADSLHVPHTEWQEATTGVSRREILSLAARSLAGSYKKLLAISAAET